MQSKTNFPKATDSELADAIRAWHNGATITAYQADLIDAARRQVLIRAFGFDVLTTATAQHATSS